jgi:hypothetical protein
MSIASNISSLTRSARATRLTTGLAACFLLLCVGCADAAPRAPGPFGRYDAGATGDGDGDGDGEGDGDGDGDDSDPVVDEDTTIPGDDTDTDEPDAGEDDKPTAGKDAGGFDLSDLFPPAPDAGTAPAGPRNVKGPCKDLQLFCFDPFDMFIINPSDCFTCNDGKGCQGCAFPYAY